MFGDVDDGVGILEKFRGKSLDINASLAKFESEGEIVGGVGLLEIGLSERIAYEITSFRGRIGGEEHGGSIDLEDVIGFFFSEESADAGYAFRAGGLDLFPEGVQFLGLGFELSFVQLSEMEAIGFGFFGAKVGAGGGLVWNRSGKRARCGCAGGQDDQQAEKRGISHCADSVGNDEFKFCGNALNLWHSNTGANKMPGGVVSAARLVRRELLLLFAWWKSTGFR